MNDEGGSTRCGHHHSPQGYFLFGRWVRADAAAVFAALLLLGSRITLDAALAAFLLVTSRFELRFGIAFPRNVRPSRIDQRARYGYYIYGS